METLVQLSMENHIFLLKTRKYSAILLYQKENKMDQIIELIEKQRKSPNFNDANLGFMAYRVKEFGEGIIMLLMPKLGELYAREETFFEYAKNYNEWIQTKEKKVMFFDIWVGMVATNQLEKEGTVKAIPKDEQISYEEALAYVRKKEETGR